MGQRSNFGPKIKDFGLFQKTVPHGTEEMPYGTLADGTLPYGREEVPYGTSSIAKAAVRRPELCERYFSSNFDENLIFLINFTNKSLINPHKSS